jgi:hypothetical protein
LKFVLKLIIVPLMAAGPSHFWGAKSNPKRLSSEMLLCRTGPLRRKSGKTWYAKVLAAIARAWPPLHQNLLSPCNRTRPPLFCLISAEAYLLTGKIIMQSFNPTNHDPDNFIRSSSADLKK